MKKLVKSLRSIFYFIQNYFIKAGSPIGIYYQNLSQECYNFFEQDMKKSAIFLKSNDIRKYSISRAFNNSKTKENLFLEFGVYKGDSINLFGNFLSQHGKKIYGFDSFEGLEEEWNFNDYNPIGTFSLNKKSPKVLKNVSLIQGKVQSTLENFLKDKKDKKIIFAHLDMDTYTPTKYTLNKIKPFLQKGSVILFDEFYGFPNWQHHEYKAFSEEFKKDEYKYIAFCESEVAVEIL
tara:strand:- start:142 stop:846 length:705 start_codon:yes stop_codon:yes gene_type:complete